MDIAEKKNILRQSCREKTSKISASEWKNIGSSMASKLFDTVFWKESNTVFCFVSMKNEPNTLDIIERAISDGKRLCVPRITGKGTMDKIVIKSLDDLIPQTLGILEPRDELADSLSSECVNLAVIPCFSAAADGTRLGKGGGYYDRFLSDFSGISTVLCAEALFSEESIPVEKFDRNVNYILTEKKLIKVK